jgi:hypothetical protein
MTMIEMLVALALLGAITAAIVSWIQVTIHAGARYAEPARWSAAADAVLQRIHDDIVTGDFGGDAREPQVSVNDGALSILTRPMMADSAPGPTLHRYTFDRVAGALRMESFTGGRPTGQRDVRPLLGRVTEWNCTIGEEHTTLTVAITSDARARRRSFSLP